VAKCYCDDQRDDLVCAAVRRLPDAAWPARVRQVPVSWPRSANLTYGRNANTSRRTRRFL